MNTLPFFFFKLFFHESDSSGYQLNSQTHVSRVTDRILKENQISSPKNVPSIRHILKRVSFAHAQSSFTLFHTTSTINFLTVRRELQLFLPFIPSTSLLPCLRASNTLFLQLPVSCRCLCLQTPLLRVVFHEKNHQYNTGAGPVVADFQHLHCLLSTNTYSTGIQQHLAGKLSFQFPGQDSVRFTEQ